MKTILYARPTKLLAVLGILLLAAIVVVTAAYAAPGDLDTSFGSGGIVTTSIGPGYDEAYAIAIQPDGKIVAAGSTEVGGSSDFAVARYNPDGSLDTSFSGDGIVITDIGTGYDYVYALAIQPDGKIVAVGGAYSFSRLAVARYNTDGSLDTAFGTNGIVTTTATSFCIGGAVSILADGKILTGGVCDFDAALVRFNADGSLDTSFGNNGLVITDAGPDNNDILDMVVQPDGKIVAAGGKDGGCPGDGKFIVYRYNADGQLDTTFDTDGIAITDFGSSWDAAYDVAAQPDGKIIAVGFTYSGGGCDYGYDIALARYNVDGSLDTSFDGDGKVTTAIGSLIDSRAYAAVLLPDGKIVAVGYVESTPGHQSFALVRYNADGSLDTSFSEDGIATTDIGSGAQANDAAIQSDGEIVAVGSSYNGSSNDFALARYLGGDLPTPTPTETFTPTPTDTPTPTPMPTETFTPTPTDTPTPTPTPGVPAAPTLISPPDHSHTSDHALDFSWSAVTFGDTYRIQISDNSDFSSPIQDVVVAGLTYTASPLTKDMYYWRVQAINSMGVAGPWSSVYSFRITH